MMIECFTKALDEAASISNIQSSFKKTGIVPVNPSEPLSNEFTFDNAGIYTDIRDSFLNNKCINDSEESLKELFKYEFKHEGSEEELKLSIDRIKEMARQSHSNALERGRLLTMFPEIYVDHGEIIERIKLEN